MNLRSLLSGLPQGIRYIAIIGLVMLILYVCLVLTRILGQNRGEKVDYNNPEEADAKVPDLFAATPFKHKPGKDNKTPPSEND